MSTCQKYWIKPLPLILVSISFVQSDQFLETLFEERVDIAARSYEALELRKERKFVIGAAEVFFITATIDQITRWSAVEDALRDAELSCPFDYFEFVQVSYGLNINHHI